MTEASGDINVPNIYSTGARAIGRSGSSNELARAPVDGLLGAGKRNTLTAAANKSFTEALPSFKSMEKHNAK